MLTFASEHPFYRRVGLWVLLAQFSLFIWELPPFQSGIWLQTEQIVYAVFVFGMAGTLWCIWGIIRGSLTCRPCHPLWLCMALWIGWQAVATSLAPAPWRSWFGAPETGEGVAWYIALLLLMVVVSPFWQIASCRRLLFWTAVANILLQCVMDGIFPLTPEGRYIPGSWRPGTWAAYLAFMAGYVWIAWAAVPRARSLRDYAAMVVFMVAVLYMSHNVSARVLLGLAMFISLKPLLFAYFRRARRFLYPSHWWRMTAIAGCVVPLAWIVFSAYFTTIEPYTRSLGPLSILSDKDGSIGSRIFLNQMSVAALTHEPRRWLIGKGWGGFSDVAFCYALVDGGVVYKNGLHRPNNLMVDGYSFHSHNQPLEALLSLGLPGLVLWLLLPVVVITTIPKRYFWPCVPMLVGLVCLSNLWFETAECLPYEALALVALGALGTGRISLKAHWVRAVLILGAMAMGWSAWQQKQAITYGVQLRQAAHALPYGDYLQSWLESDISHGGDRLRSSALFYTNWLGLKMKTLGQMSGLDNNDRGWLEKFMLAAHDASESPAVGAYAASLQLRLVTELLAELDDPVLKPLRQKATDDLPRIVLQLAAKAPLRDDVATPFLLNLPESTHHDVSQQVEILNKILAVAPDHRGALWVLGGLLGSMPSYEAEGHAMRARAVQLGVERVYLISDEELAAQRDHLNK